jgi:hypothetical protein
MKTAVYPHESENMVDFNQKPILQRVFFIAQFARGWFFAVLSDGLQMKYREREFLPIMADMDARAFSNRL